MAVCTVAAVTTVFLSMHSERFCDLMFQGFPDYYVLVGLGSTHTGAYSRNATIIDRYSAQTQ